LIDALNLRDFICQTCEQDLARRQCKAVCACDCELISGRRYAVRVRLCS